MNTLDYINSVLGTLNCDPIVEVKDSTASKKELPPIVYKLEITDIQPKVVEPEKIVYESPKITVEEIDNTAIKKPTNISKRSKKEKSNSVTSASITVKKKNSSKKDKNK